MTGKPIPACSTRKKLAVLVGGHEGMFLLMVPPDSLDGFKQYMSALAKMPVSPIAKMPVSPEELVTRIKMENKQLVFEAVDWVPENLMAYIAEKIESDDAASIVNRHDEARDPTEFKALGAPTAAAQPPAPQPQPAAFPPSGAPPAPRPRGRPPKLATPVAPPQPAFQAPQTVLPPQSAEPPMQAPPGFGFGMQTAPQAPDPGVQGMLDRAFSLPRRA